MRTYLEVDGLPSASVHDIAQDLEGCLWFSTRAGIASYDGARWKRVGEADGLPEADMRHLWIDDDGRLWAAADRVPVRVVGLSGERWEQLPPAPPTDPGHQVTALDSDGGSHDLRIVAGTTAGHLQYWDGAEWSSRSLSGDPAELLPIHALALDGDRVLVATDRGLLTVSLEPDLGEPEKVPGIPPGPVDCVRRSPDGEYFWVTSPTTVGRLDGAGFHVERGGLDLVSYRGHPASVIEPDDTGGIWFGTASRLHHYHPGEELERFGVVNGLASDGTTSLLLDREGNVWIGSLRGLSKIPSRRFESWDRSFGLAADEVTAVVERSPGEYVLGHPTGLTFFGAVIRPLRFGEDSTRGRVSELAKGPDGSVWGAANFLGAVRIDPAGHLRWYRKKQGVEEGVSAVQVDSDGGVWLGGTEGLFRLEGDDTFRRVPVSGGEIEASGFVRRIASGPDGGLLLGTSEYGVLRIVPERNGAALTGSYRSAEGAAADNVYALLARPDGEVLVGTRAGLFRVGANALERVDLPGPQVDRPVYLIVADRHDQLWFGTDNGVLRWDGETLRPYGVADGLAGFETNRGAGLLDSRGRLWIGTDRGVSIYREENDRPRPHPPTVDILALDTRLDEFRADVPRELGADHRSITFRFRAISFIDERRVRFRAWLEGFEPAPVELHSFPDRQVRYINLPPGEYRFHLSAVDAEGVESAEAVSAPIRIRAPLTEVPWFRAIVAIAGLALVAATVAWWAQRRHARELEGAVRRRTAELERSEAAMAAEKERLSITLASLREGVAAADREGRIAVWNEAAAAITGRSEEDVRGRPIEEILGEFGEEIDYHPSRGGARRLEISRAPIGAGGSAGSVVVFRDVTERREIEREREEVRRLESLGVLAGGIAHDFNNLMTVILGYLSLFDTLDLGPEPRAWVSESLNASRQVRALTRQLLAFSKGGAPVRQQASMAELLRDSSAFVLRGSNVVSRLDIAEDLWSVDIDAGQMSQVVTNLLLNARQAMPEGGTVTLRARNVERPPSHLASGPSILVEVADDGPGIPTEALPRVFEPYFSTKPDGSGLGLATAYAIVDRHEGRLAVRSKPGEGTAFRMYLPASRSPRPNEPAVEAPRPPVSGMRLLIMESEEAVRRVIVGWLERLGSDVVAVADAETAIACYRTASDMGTPFDGVLLDLTVPGGPGAGHTVRRLLEIDPGVRALVTSGYADDPILDDPGAHGFVGALRKPFTPESLAAALESLRGRRSALAD